MVRSMGSNPQSALPPVPPVESAVPSEAIR